MAVTLVVITCPRVQARLIYLDHTLRALRERLAPEPITRWVVSTETHGIALGCMDELRSICDRHRFDCIGHPGAAQLGRHMNWLLKTQLQGLFFFAQDDFVLTQPLDLTPGVKLIESGGGQYVRYLINDRPAQYEDLIYPGFCRMPDDWNYPYGDPQFLAHTDFFKQLGPWIERGGHEAEMTHRVRDSGMPVWIAIRRPFVHIGEESVLGHNCPFAKFEDLRFNKP